MPIILYRGHKDEDYTRTTRNGLCFCENIELAVAYGLGKNNDGDPKRATGEMSPCRASSTGF